MANPIYKNKEKRKQYLKDYHKKNRAYTREKYRDYFREYMRSYMRKKNDSNNDSCFNGKCLIGRKFEKIALDMLKGSIDCNLKSFHGPWDIEWNGKNIEVKSRTFDKKYGGYNIVAPTSTADYILAFCVSDEQKIEHIAFVPRDKYGKSFFINPKNKLNKYNKFLVTIEFFNRLQSEI